MKKRFNVLINIKILCTTALAALFWSALGGSVLAVGTGTAPVDPPTGGFAIDGNLTADGGIGDWVPGTGVGNVLSSAGVPVDPSITFHLSDLSNSANDDIFEGGHKYFHDPNTWTWKSAASSDKLDIENGLIHLTQDPITHHIWVIVAADRYKDTGAAYIDIEFLQNTLTRTGVTGGGFASAGPNGGRTANDFLLQLSLGGASAGFSVERWEETPLASGNYTYVDKTTEITSLVPTAVYAALNTVDVSVPYNVFDGSVNGFNTYQENTFVEGAVDLSALVSKFNACETLGIKTIMMKTKSSPAPAADLEDFIDPKQVALTLGLANAGKDLTQCSGGSSTTFTVTGEATPSPGDTVKSKTWSLVSGSADIVSPNSLTTDVNVITAPVTLMLTVKTDGGCTATDTVVLTITPGPALLVPTDPAKCFGDETGAIHASASGGTSPYQFSTDSGTTYQDSGDFTDLAAGDYTVTVKDANGCTTKKTATISQPDAALTCTASQVSPVSCKGEADGSASVTPVGGNGGNTFLWDNGQTTATATGLNAGSHSVTVTDSKNCTTTCSVNISEPEAALTCTASQVSPVSCKGGADGSALVTPAGGNGGNTFLWDNGQTTATATGLNAGSHSVTVTDSKNCTTTCSVNISEPAAALTCTASQVSPVSCKGGTDGSASVTPVGGNGGNTFLWDNGQTTATATGLNASSHSVTVTDSKNCTTTCSVNINEPAAALTCTASQVSPVSCKGGTDGSASVTPVGGNGGNTFLWDNGQTTATATGLNASSHSVTVTDSKNCTTTCSVNISEPAAALTCTASQVSPVSCKGGTDGSASVTPVGGNGGNTFLWDNGQTTATATGLNASSHSVTVTDSKNCTTTCSVNISEPALLGLTLGVSQPTCPVTDGSITANPTGGTQPFTYSKDNFATFQTSPTFGGLSPGSCTIKVKDANECTATASATLDNALCNGHILPTGTTCAQYYPTITVPDLTQICYNIKGTKINNVAPGVFFYYTLITAPSSTFTVNITESVSPSYKLFDTQKDQVIVYDTSCRRLQTVVVSVNATTKVATLTIKSAIPGATYIISTKYSTGGVVGQKAVTGNTWNYTFTTKVGGVVVDGTKNGILLKECK